MLPTNLSTICRSFAQNKVFQNIQDGQWPSWQTYHLEFQKWYRAVSMTSQTMCKINQLRENIEDLTLRQRISNSFEKIVN